MTRPLNCAVAITLLALGVSLLVPTLAAAADAAPWVGTYKGVGVGKDASGNKGKSGVTIWVEDLGDSTKFTFRFDKFPVVISQTAPNDGGTKGSMLMGISVDEPGVNGAGLIVVYPRNGNYLMAGKGAGTALRKEGTGRMGAVRTSTGVQLPSMKQQVKDLFTALLTRKIKSSSGTSGGGSSSVQPAGSPPVLSDDVAAGSGGEATSGALTTTQYDPDAVVKEAPTVVFVKATTVEPVSVLDVAANKPPATTQTTFTVMLVVLALVGIAAIIGVGPKTQRPAAATVPAEQSGDDEEGM